VPGTYADRYREDPRRAVEEFTALLHAAMAGQVVHLEHPELGALVLDIEAVYREELLTRADIPLPGGSRFTREAILAGEIAKAVTHFETHDPAALRALADELALYGTLRAKLGVPEVLLRPGALPSARLEAARSVLPLILGLPLAAWGVVWCGLPYRLTAWILHRRRPDPSKMHWTRLWVGFLVYGLYYPALLALAVLRLGLWPAVALGASLLPAGLFAMAYGRFWQRRKSVIRLGWLATARLESVEGVRERRRRLLAELDRMLAEYLHRRGLVPRTGPGGLP
jgi:hypothetical protein